MSDTTSISWTDSTFNPWEGCEKVSPGCKNCYAEALNHRWGKDNWGPGKERRRTSEANWRKPIKWNRDGAGSFQQVELRNGTIHRGTIEDIAALNLLIEDIVAAGPAIPRVFCGSMCDWLDDEMPIEVLARLLALIHDTPNLTWQLLTKRPENWSGRIDAVAQHVCDGDHEGREDAAWFASKWRSGEGPARVWIGTSVENQEWSDKRIPELLKIPARVRFLSVEPMLGPVELADLATGWPLLGGDGRPQIHWVICGGESGANRRPFNVEWAEDLARQCEAAGVPFFMKQDAHRLSGQQGRIPGWLWEKKQFPSA